MTKPSVKRSKPKQAETNEPLGANSRRKPSESLKLQNRETHFKKITVAWPELMSYDVRKTKATLYSEKNNITCVWNTNKNSQICSIKMSSTLWGMASYIAGFEDSSWNPPEEEGELGNSLGSVCSRSTPSRTSEPPKSPTKNIKEILKKGQKNAKQDIP